jgi:DNA (cytosine-5)-methyltransferase 1
MSGKLDLPVVSLFTGIGGLDLGMERAGFRVAVAVEADPVRAEVLKANRPRWNVVCEDVRRLDAESILSAGGLLAREPALVVGGPPCQPFSKAALWIKKGSADEDPRALLVLEFYRVVRDAKPLGFIMENVQGLFGKLGNQVFSAFVRKVRRCGYAVSWEVLDACDYGVPQKRRRLFVIGYRRELGVSPSFPKPTHGPANAGGLKAYVTSGQAIGDLDDGVVRPDEVPRGKWGSILKAVPPGRNYLWLCEKRGSLPVFKYRSRYWSFLLKLHPGQPSWTIPAHPGPFTGPFHWRSRRLRIAEVKRLQTFPDGWKLIGTPREMWSQLGDAVPPVLAEKVGKHVYRQLFAREQRAR